MAQFDRGPGERMAQRMLTCRLADGWEQSLAEQQPGPATKDDPLRADQVDQVGDADADVGGRLGKDLLRRWRCRGQINERGERRFLVLAGQWPAEPVKDRLGAHVSLQAPSRSAAAGAPSHRDGGVAPLGRARRDAAPGVTAGDDAGTYARTDQAHHGVPGATARTEPEFRLAHRLGAVVDVERQVRTGPEQPFQRDRLPAEGLPVHEQLRPVLDDAGDPDTYPQD